MGTKVVTRAPHREVGDLNTTWLLEHEVEHELHLEHRFSIAALACPVLLDIVHQFPELARPAVAVAGAGAKPQTFVFRNASKLSQAEQLVLTKGYRLLAVTNEHIDGAERHCTFERLGGQRLIALGMPSATPSKFRRARH